MMDVEKAGIKRKKSLNFEVKGKGSAIDALSAVMLSRHALGLGFEDMS